MKRFFLGSFIILIFFLTIVGHNKLVSAIVCLPTPGGERCAACDLCGYCWKLTPIPPATNPPASWENCRNCLYPVLTSVPAQNNETLKIDPIAEQPPTPIPGHWYTMIGCVNTNLSGFSEPGAAASLVTKLLGLIFKGVGGIAFLYFLYGAFIMLTSQADPEKLGHGKSVIYGAIIGLIFSLLSVFIVSFIAQKILKIPGFQ